MTLDYPQVDEWLIKALEATLAPFAQPEKPQVFPTPATSFIKSGPHIIMLEGSADAAVVYGVDSGESPTVWLCPF
jgi:hypothetical protein